MNILITGCAGPAGRALAHQLSGSPHTLVGVDMESVDDPTLTSAFARITTVPAASDPGMLTTLRALVDEHGIDLVIPTVSEELVTVAEAAVTFPHDTHVLVGEPAAVATAHDKHLTMHRLAERGVAVPRFGLPSEFADTADALAAMGGPLVLKPRVSRGGRGVTVVDAPDDIAWGGLDDSLIVQEFAPGLEYCPAVHRPGGQEVQGKEPTADDGLVVVLVKTALQQGRVGNAASVERVAENSAPDVARLALETTRALGLTGPCDLDLRRRADGTPVVLEVNARFGANSSESPEILRAVLTDPGLTDKALNDPGTAASRPVDPVGSARTVS